MDLSYRHTKNVYSVIVLFLIAILWNVRASRADQTAALSTPNCQSDPGFQVLDFWIGTWDVVSNTGQKQGTNRIEKILDGCAIMEHWTDIRGSEGKSIFYYNHFTATWKQVWITQDTTRPGGLKEKTLIERFEDGGVRFQGTIQLEDGTYLDRTTLIPRDDGSVLQKIEYSTDDGQTWLTSFEAVYLAMDD